MTDQRVVAWPGASPSVGQSAERSRLVTEEDIVGFTDLSGDRNPLHYDEVCRFGSNGGRASAVRPGSAESPSADSPWPDEGLLVKLTGSGLLTIRSLEVGRPFSPDQLTVPAQEGLGPGQEELPALTGKNPIQRDQEEPVRWLPWWPFDLALEDSQLVAKGWDLCAEASFLGSAHKQDLEEERTTA